jgi:hypothetical protein
MTKLLSVFAVIAVLLSVAPQAPSQEISVNFFYDNLNGGSWFEVGDYGYCWQPDVAVNDPTWRPYADGYWAYTDDGWTWVSYEDFGWAAYHYGRWVKLTDYGWVWKPGYEWGPAWVSWRSGGNYIGWAPLPPETEYVYESRPLTGHIDVEFDIGPGCYNFVDVRYIGEPVLRSRLVSYEQNVTYVTQTVNVTNITYKNKTVYNYGPDINVVNQYSSRPIQKLKLERQTNVDVAAAAKSGGLTKVQGNALIVAAPTRLNKPAKEIAPPTVKTKVAQPKIEKGWSVAGDPNAQTQLKEKIKSEDLKKVPPPTTGEPANAAAGANASAAPGGSAMSPAPGTGTSPIEKGKGKNKNKAAEMQNAGPAGASTSPGTSPVFPEHGKKKGKNAGQFQPGAPTSAPGSPVTGASPSVMPESGKPGKAGKGRRGEQLGGSPATPGPGTSPEGMTAPEGKKGKQKGMEPRNLGPTPGGATAATENLNEPRGGKQKKFEKQQQPGMSPASPTGPGYGSSSTGVTPQGGSSPGAEGHGKHKAENLTGPPPPSGVNQTGGAQLEGAQGGKYMPDQEEMKKHRQGASPVEGQQGQGQRQGKKQGAESPAPTPQ